MKMHVVVVVLEVEAYYSYFDCSYFDYFDYCLRDVVVLVVIVVAVCWCWWWSEVEVTGRGVGWERVGYRQSWTHVDYCCCC